MTYPWQATSDLLVSPYVGLYGDYRFSTDSALPVGIAFVGIKDGWSERVTTGLTMKSGLAGPSLSLGAELGGLGAGYNLWSANARVNWPFQSTTAHPTRGKSRASLRGLSASGHNSSAPQVPI